MISPDILKQSATAGLAGAAVAATVFALTVVTHGPTDSEIDTTEWTVPVHVSFDRAEEITDRAERRADTAADRSAPSPARQAALQARNRAARRALEKLQAIECRRVDQAKIEAQKVRLHINRAARAVIEQP